jgi:hypothetical protein
MYPGSMGLKRTVWETDRIDDYVSGHATPQIKCLFGHLAYFGVHRLLGPESTPRYVTFMRDPVERCISQYFYRQSKDRSGERPLKRRLPLEDWLETTGVSNRQLRQLLVQPYGDALTRRELTTEDLEEGKRRLREFWFVGLTETFEEDANYLYRELRFGRSPRERVVNATPVKGEVSPTVRQRIADRNALDIELYAFARQHRSEVIDRALSTESSSHRNENP